MNYLIVSFVCIIALFIGILSLYENELFSYSQRKRFIILSIIIIVEIIIDTIAITVDSHPEIVTIYKILKIVEFTLTPLIPTFLASLIANQSFWIKIRKILYSIIGVNAVAQSITYFLPFMFYIDEGAIYYRTIFTYFYIGILIICFIFLMLSVNNSFIKNVNNLNGTAYSINVFFFLGMIIRLFNSKNNSDWLCITVGLFLFIIYFNNSYLKIDPTTLLLDRKVFNTKLTRITYNTAIIVIDANKFKVVNDTYGHQSGDIALLKIAERILKVYGKVGHCYRIGGDEFCVILKRNMLKKLAYGTKNCDIYSALDNLSMELDKEIEKKSQKYAMLKFGVSQGYDIYYSLNDLTYPIDYKTINDVLKTADENMYKKKNLNQL